MKRFITLLMLWGINPSAFTQIEVPAGKDPATQARWEILPAKNLKPGLGRLNLNFPPGLEWSVDIYKGSKFIINRSIETYRLKYHDLAPGTYSFKVNTVLIENVPIEAGKITTLRTGVLDIQSSDWELRSEDSKKFHTSGNKAKKIALPVGRYELEEGRTKRIVEVLYESGVLAAEKNIEGDYPKWIIKKPDSALAPDKGRLRFFIPVVDNYYYSLHTGQVKLNTQTTLPWRENNDILPGVYNIRFNGIPVENVPIIAGYETRLKVGSMASTRMNNSNNYWQLASSNTQGTYSIPGAGGAGISDGWVVIIPKGEYYIKSTPSYADYTDPSYYFSIALKDSQFINLNSYLSGRPPTNCIFWETSVLPNAVNEARLSLDLPAEAHWKIEVLDRPTRTVVANAENDPSKLPSSFRKTPYKILNPGVYSVRLSNVLIYTVVLEAGYETKLYAGVVDISTVGSWKLYIYRVSSLGSFSYELVEEGNNLKKIALPVGEYKLVHAGNEHYIEMKDGKTFKY
jgi:hypothetical protein